MGLDTCLRYNSIDILENIEMINNKVLVEVFDNRAKTESGIDLPITIDNPFIPYKGIVFKKPALLKGFKTGDEVIIEKYKGVRIFVGVIEVRQFILLDASYVLAVIQK